SQFVHRGMTNHVTVVRGDIRDRDLLERILGEYEIDTIFHLAAQTIVPIANRNPSSTFESNIRGTWNLLEAVRRSTTVKNIVVASTDKAYGQQENLPYTEDAPLQGRHPYDASKSCADLISQTYAATYELPVAITRCGNFYGGGDLNWNRIVPGTIRSILRNQRPIIRSDGRCVRDYFYVEDGAEAYLTLGRALMDDPALRGEAFNFSNELQITVLGLVKKILSLMDSNLEPVILNEATNEIPHQFLSAEKARRGLNWKPLYSLDDGLARTIEWYRNFFRELDKIRKIPLLKKTPSIRKPKQETPQDASASGR
ncbi:MAG: GDP-mannose 4,6-dehydratase, partial [Planctomycetota bacterium]